MFVDEGAGGDHAGHRAIDDALRILRILDLIGDRNAEALLDKPAQILLGGMVGNARHRHAGGAFGEGDAEGLVRPDRVLAKELVEVPHPEEEQAARMRLLEAAELPHGRRVEGREQAISIGRGRRHLDHCAAGRGRRHLARCGLRGHGSSVRTAIAVMHAQPGNANAPPGGGALAVERMRIELTTS